MKKYPFKVSVLNALSRSKVFSRMLAIALCVIAVVSALACLAVYLSRHSASQAWASGFRMSLWSGTEQRPYNALSQGFYAQKKTAKPKKPVKPAPAKEEQVKPKPEAQKPEELVFDVKEFPDGLVGRLYNFVLTSEKAVPPYNVTLVSGAIPPGLAINQRTGGVDGEPTQAGEYELTLRVDDAQGKRGTFSGKIRVWRPLSVGEHGTFKGVDGLQMALNVAQDMDDIRLERGIYEGSGFSIPQGKDWSHWIKMSGGWNETFEEKSSNPEDTILDGGGKGSRILTIPEPDSKGKVSLENLTSRNSKGGAVRGGDSFTNCIFTGNSVSGGGSCGGAVYGGGTFTNCTFAGNSTMGDYSYGGAVYGGGTFINCTFTSSSTTTGHGAVRAGGAVSGDGIFTNCTFTSNKGSAVFGSGTFTNCTFASNSDGAVWLDYRSSSVTFTNCTFTSNYSAVYYNGVGNSVTATDCTFTSNSGYAVHVSHGKVTFTNCTVTSNSNGAAVWVDQGSSGTFTNCTFTNNSNGAAVWVDQGSSGTFTNCTFTNNSAKNGGAVYGGGTFTNCTFTSNSATGSGGAVSGDGIFTNCTFTGNSAEGEGGAVSGGSSFVNCLFYKNSAYSGGVIRSSGEVINCTFYGNSAKEEGGAIRGSKSIINSIFYKNMAGGKDNDIASTESSMEIDYSLVSYLKGAANFGAHNIMMVNPKFVDPEQGDFHLRPDSPCVNAGNEVPEAFKERPLDLDGKPRVVGGKIDMGAYEWQGE
jgi:predicted outer membrane repeat protein